MLPALPAGVTETDAWTLLLLIAKASLVLALAALVTRPLRRAAARHLVWSLALGALLVLPPLALSLPAWRLPWLRVSTQAPPLLTGPAGALVQLPGRVPAPLELLLVAIWAAGALAVLGRMLTGWHGVRRMGQGARPVADAALLAELGQLRVAARVGPRVRLLRGESAVMPVTWGVLQPTVLLPAAADGWSRERRRVVLLHELAHVARRDWLTQTLATLCCAVYWFHPGAWWAARQMRLEREEACDDRVLAAGAHPTDYAGHLLEVARACRRATRLSSAALAMARPSNLESRVRAVLDGRRDRRGVAYGAGAMVALGVGLALLPLASAAPTEEVVAMPALPGRVALPVARRAEPAFEPAPVRVAALPAPARVPARTLRSPSLQVPAAPARAAAPPPPERIEALAVEAAVLRSRSLSELIRATTSPQTAVRRDAVRALAQIRDEAVVSPLARSLRDRDAGVRTMAARALGDMAVVRPRVSPSEPDPGPAAPPEPPAEAAAYALASRAAEALRVSLVDENPDVRDTALRALEEMGDAMESAGGGIPAATLQTGISTLVSPAN